MSKKKLAQIIGGIILIVTMIALPSCQTQTRTPPTYGLEFDGADDYVTLGNATALGFTSQNFTIEAWIKPDNVTKTMQIFQRHYWNRDGYRLSTSSSGRLAFSTFQSGAGQTTTSDGTLIAGNWSHVAVVRTGTSVTLYINGVNMTNNISNSHIDPAYNATRIARIGTNAPGMELFEGCISEVRVWNYACSESQIKANMYKKLTGSESGLVGYWKLNEGSGTIAHDSTANNITGTLYGDPVWFTGGG